MSDNNSNNNSNSSLNGFSGAQKNNSSDVDAIKNRGQNEPIHNSNYSKRNEFTKKSHDDELEKDGLEDNNDLKEKSSDKSSESKKNDNKKSKKDSISDKLENINPVAKISKKMVEIKVKLIILGIILGFLVVLFLIGYFYNIFDSFYNVVGNYFGIPEGDTTDKYTGEEVKGYASSDEYFLNPGTNEGASIEEFVANMKADSTCMNVQNTSFWNALENFFSLLFQSSRKFKDPCDLIRYIESSETDWEKKEPGLKMDRALIVAGIFYGYTAQPAYSNYKDASSVEVVSPVYHFETLSNIINEGKLTTEHLDAMIDNSISIIDYKYYIWETEQVNYSDRYKRYMNGEGFCREKHFREANYSLLKWQIFMRFGEDTAKDYDKYTSYARGYAATDDECKGVIDNAGLLAEVEAATGLPPLLDGSVASAIAYQKDKNYTGLDAFEQKAVVDGNKKDYFRNFYHISFDYTTGFAYTEFPIFAQAFADTSDDIEYDDAITPKEIENIIQYVYERKPAMNEILGYPDQDNPYDLNLSTYSSSVKTGEYCGDYLSAPVNEIQVLIKDCNGQELMITSFKDYIMGVAYGEASYYNDDNILTQMVAAISYALKRRNNYQNGSTIIMRAGDCDQAYCSMKLGCHTETSAVDCTSTKKCTSFLPGPGHHPIASADLYNKYAALYDRASDFLVVKDGEVYGTSYASGIQNEWTSKALSGMSFTQIIQETYGEAELIRCSENPNSKNDDTDTGDRIGSKATASYPEEAPDKGIYYGFSYAEADGNNITINPEWVNANITTISTNCSQAEWNISRKVHVKAKSKFETAFASMCKMLTEGVKTKDGVCKYTASDFNNADTYNPRKTSSGGYSLHAYALAIDFNYNKTYYVNGTIYSPYTASRSLEKYTEFYNALGGEEKCENVNYILWKYAFEPAGFNWGGNWGRNGNGSTFDGMHFEVSY